MTNTMDPLKKVLDLVNLENKWRLHETINLIASENVMSTLALKAYLSDFMFRYAEGKPFKRYYQGTKIVDELEVYTGELLGGLLETEYIELRPISGTIANASVFRVLAEPGDKAVIAPVQAGAHVSHTKFGTLGALGIKHVEMPYDAENMNVDIDGAIKLIEKESPKFAVLGGSVYLFPHPVKEISDAIHSVGGKLVYDAAHVLGLIIGGAWRNPLKHGADAMTASTHKTFPGPQGGLVAFTEKDLYKKVSKTIFPWFLSNHHLHRLAALAVTTIEMIKFGKEYASQTVSNAKHLAEALASEGFNVIGESLGYTKSHQVLVDVRNLGGGAKVAKLLEDANIIVNKNLLPWDPPEAVKDPSGIRIGVQEVTRWGMNKDEMYQIAKLMGDLLIRNKPVEEIRKKVIEFKKQYTKIHYALEGEVTTILDLVS